MWEIFMNISGTLSVPQYNVMDLNNVMNGVPIQCTYQGRVCFLTPIEGVIENFDLL